LAAVLILKNWIYLFLPARDFKKASRDLAPSPGARDSAILRYAKNPVIGIIVISVKTSGDSLIVANYH
jgi:hypothetical protein